jgi:hypothetical protein
MYVRDVRSRVLLHCNDDLTCLNLHCYCVGGKSIDLDCLGQKIFKN